MKPEKKSGNQRLLEFLLSGCKIACKDAYRLIQVADLRSRVSDLERKGFTIQRERVKGKNYNQYWL